MAAPKGNSNAAKARDWADSLRWALENYDGPGIPRGMALRKIAQDVVQEAIENKDWKAREEIFVRMDGKPAQAITVAGDDSGDPIRTISEVLMRAVDAASDRPT